MSFEWKITAQTKRPASPQLSRISDGGGVDAVRQLNSAPRSDRDGKHRSFNWNALLAEDLGQLALAFDFG